jgi:hypothetical protein
VRRVRRVYMEVCWVELVRAFGGSCDGSRGARFRAAGRLRSIGASTRGRGQQLVVGGASGVAQPVSFLVSRAPFLLLALGCRIACRVVVLPRA